MATSDQAIQPEKGSSVPTGARRKRAYSGLEVLAEASLNPNSKELESMEVDVGVQVEVREDQQDEQVDAVMQTEEQNTSEQTQTEDKGVQIEVALTSTRTITKDEETQTSPVAVFTPFPPQVAEDQVPAELPVEEVMGVEANPSLAYDDFEVLTHEELTEEPVVVEEAPEGRRFRGRAGAPRKSWAGLLARSPPLPPRARLSPPPPSPVPSAPVAPRRKLSVLPPLDICAARRGSTTSSYGEFNVSKFIDSALFLDEEEEEQQLQVPVPMEMDPALVQSLEEEFGLRAPAAAPAPVNAPPHLPTRSASTSSSASIAPFSTYKQSGAADSARATEPHPLPSPAPSHASATSSKIVSPFPDTRRSSRATRPSLAAAEVAESVQKELERKAKSGSEAADVEGRGQSVGSAGSSWGGGADLDEEMGDEEEKPRTTYVKASRADSEEREEY